MMNFWVWIADPWKAYESPAVFSPFPGFRSRLWTTFLCTTWSPTAWWSSAVWSRTCSTRSSSWESTRPSTLPPRPEWALPCSLPCRHLHSLQLCLHFITFWLLSSHFTAWCSPDAAVRQIQRRDRVWGKASSLRAPSRFLNASLQLLLSAGGCKLQKHSDCRETDVLLCSHPWRESVGQGHILTHKRDKLTFFCYSLTSIRSFQGLESSWYSSCIVL